MEDGKVENKMSSESFWLKRWKIAAILFFSVIGFAILFENGPTRNSRPEGWYFFFAFISIPIALTGILEKLWGCLKSDKELRRAVYCIAIITYLGGWSTVIVDKFLSSPTRLNVNLTTPSNLDINLKTPSYAPIKIENKHTYEGNRGY